MAKDIDEKDDDKLQNAEITDSDGRDSDGESERDTSIRGALKAAVKEVEEKEDEDPEDEREEKSSSRDDKLVQKKPKESVSDRGREESDKKDDKEFKQEKVEDKTEPPPPYYKTKGKAVWDKLTPEDKQLILAREKEVSDGFAQASPKVRAFEELERVIAPRLPAIQKFGTTPAATIDRLFQWMEALSDQDEGKRASSFKQLASNFGINLAQLESTKHDGTDPTLTESQDPPAWAQGIVGEVTQLKNQLTTQQQAAADAAVTSWATSKDSTGTPLRPHYSKVNQLMYQLMVSGAVPMKDGNLDLDGAYEAACRINPEVIALIQQEQIAKAEQETKDKAAKDAQLAKARLEKAKRAGVGLKPSAPSMPVAQVKGKTNGTGRETTSVRDSLRLSLDQLRDN